MPTYRVFQSPERLSESQLNFVPDRNSWMALAFPIVWLLYHRLWIQLALFALFELAILTALHDQLLGNATAITLQACLSILAFLEGPNWLAHKWMRLGYSELAELVADDVSEAEIRLLIEFSR